MTEDNDNTNKSDVLDEYQYIADLPKVEIEVDVEVPEQIWEIAEKRLELGREEFSTDAGLNDYLLDHIAFVYNYEKVGESDE